ncbi:MAG TPA: type II toxin-antitoxin system HicB family antitoxin [Thermoanaerobaculia bacterium]|nr:type II toxin-antitoxin system HicB family antitoxin [Thermoanaerobaculia bacterium]
MDRAVQAQVYKAVVHSEEEGGYWAEVPALPGCFTRGDTLDEVYQSLPEAIVCCLGRDEVQVKVGSLEFAF